LPGRELTEVFLSLAKIRADGRREAFLRHDEPLGYGYYPADRGITIPVANLTDSGFYYLQIGANLRGGGVSTVEVLFYHSHS
jgi:hypothetical protein